MAKTFEINAVLFIPTEDYYICAKNNGSFKKQKISLTNIKS